MDSNTAEVLKAFGLNPEDLKGDNGDIIKILKPFFESEEENRNENRGENKGDVDIFKLFRPFFQPKEEDSKDKDKDECVLNQRRENRQNREESDSFGFDDEDTCPVCGNGAVRFCRCSIGEATCSMGHQWYIDREGNKIIGNRHYSSPQPVPFKGRYGDNHNKTRENKTREDKTREDKTREEEEREEREQEEEIENILNSKKYANIFNTSSNTSRNNNNNSSTGKSNEYLSSVIKTAGESFLNKLKEVDFNKTFSDALSSAISKPSTATETIKTPDLPIYGGDASLMEKVRSYRNLEDSLFNTIKEMARLREEMSSQSASQQRKFWAAYHEIPYDSEMNDRMDVMVSTLQTLNNNVNSRSEPDVETIRNIIREEIREEMKNVVSETNKTLEDISDNLSILSVRSAK